MLKNPTTSIGFIFGYAATHILIIPADFPAAFLQPSTTDPDVPLAEPSFPCTVSKNYITKL